MIFELWGKRCGNEQEIIDAGCNVIYWYCLDVKGRWRDIEHLIVENEWWACLYTRDVIRGRYEPELETVYLIRHSGYWVEQYTKNLLRYGNV